jgi:excisionase family DNA binding protein
MAQRVENRKSDRLLSTGKAAQRLSVTPDTVLKWIKSGRLPAVRTAGGHYRVAERDLDGLIGDDLGPGTFPGSNGFVYCWEYYATGNGPNDGCLDCIAYRARARRCYEMSGLATEDGYVGAHCTTSCEDCSYYQEVVHRARRVLIVTESAELRRRLLDESASSRLELEFAGSEYECSAACAEFRPDYVVIDGALPKRARASLCSHLATDPRIPGVQIVLAVPGDSSFVAEADSGVDRALPRSFNLAELDDHIAGLEVTPKIRA